MEHFRALRRLADHGDKVSLEAFVKGLHDIEMGSVQDAARIFRAFETDSSGYINMKEFLFDIRYLTQVLNFRFSNSYLCFISHNYFANCYAVDIDERRNH